MKKLILIFLLAGSFICSINAQSKVSDEEYEIYAIVLKDIHRENLMRLKQKTSFVILDETVRPKFFDDYDQNKGMKGLSKDFRKKNEFTVNLENRFVTKYKFNLVSKNELENLFNIGKENAEKLRKNQKIVYIVITDINHVIWKPFYDKFFGADGYYSFSRIGFSATKRFAIIEVLGKGSYWDSFSTYIYTKTKKGWKLYNSSAGFAIS